MGLDRYLGAAVRRLLLPRFAFLERLGIHVTPVHFYQPIPHVAAIEPAAFAREIPSPGIDWRDEHQIAFAESTIAPWLAEYASYDNKMLCQIDAATYYAIVRERKPRKIVEIGCGESTRQAALARARNAEEGHPCEHVGIEPFPGAAVRRLERESGLRLVEAPVQEAPREVFEGCDLLFIDSTHIAAFGSDVVLEILDLVPRVAPGALVHWHDIFLPRQYPREWIEKDRLFWNEQFLVQAFLAFNSDFEIVWSASYMATRHRLVVENTFAALAAEDYPPSSLWVRRRARS